MLQPIVPWPIRCGMRQVGLVIGGGVDHRRGGFSLVELLAVLGIVLVLIGLVIPSLALSRERARRVACAGEMRQLAALVTMYCDENRGFIPFIYTQESHGGQWLAPNGAAVPEGYFETAADYWVYPMIHEFGYSYLDDALLCPNDFVSEEAALWASSELGRPVRQITLMLDRAVSRSFYYAPSALHRDAVAGAATMNRVAKLSDVAFPSAKALLVEESPFHDDFLVGDVFNVYTIPPYPNRHMIAAADLSVSLRSTGDAVAPVLLDIQFPDHYPGTRGEYIELQRHSVTFDYTRDGVLGRDW